MTYREDEAASAVALQRVLGGLHAPVAVRIQLRPLSARAVARLAGEPGRGLRVYASTGGNPFYVTELLAAENEGVPASVSHAVLARLATLPEPARALLELLAVVPARTEATLPDVLCPRWVEDALPAEERGMLTVHQDAVAFRHELARRAVEESLTALGARQRHARVLAALQAVGADPARLVHTPSGQATTRPWPRSRPRPPERRRAPAPTAKRRRTISGHCVWHTATPPGPRRPCWSPTPSRRR